MIRLAIAGPHALQPADEPGRWRLVEESPGERAAEVSGSPFLIGRSEDCHLVLPERDDLRAVTSRRHCHIALKDGAWWVADGAPQPAAGGRPKPSVSGTWVNGGKIAGPTPLNHGDLLKVGPWRFEVVADGRRQAEPLDAGDILRDVARGEARKLDATDPRLKEKFGQVHELVRRLAQIPGIEESLTTLLSYATDRMAAAEAGAILLSGPEGFAVRLAWQKGIGRVTDFRFSSSLLAALPPDRSVLLQAKLKDRSESQSVQDISSGLLLPLWGKGARLGILYLDNRRNGKSFTEEDLYLGSAIASIASLQLALESHSRMARVEENMARYFAPDVVQRIVELSLSDRPVGLEVQEKDVTVLFTDMESFTALSRTRSPRQISEILNPYLETVAKAIMREGGHVNKFIGDAVMGIFGAQPGEKADPAACAAQAVRAALAIPDAWRAESARRGLPRVRLRIGINSGRAVVGNIGYSARLEYSVLGDAVNLASRIEKLAPPDHAAVSDATRRLTQGLFKFEDLGLRDVKGVGRLRVYRPSSL